MWRTMLGQMRRGAAFGWTCQFDSVGQVFNCKFDRSKWWIMLLWVLFFFFVLVIILVLIGLAVSPITSRDPDSPDTSSD